MGMGLYTYTVFYVGEEEGGRGKGGWGRAMAGRRPNTHVIDVCLCHRSRPPQLVIPRVLGMLLTTHDIPTGAACSPSTVVMVNVTLQHTLDWNPWVWQCALLPKSCTNYLALVSHFPRAQSTTRAAAAFKRQLFGRQSAIYIITRSSTYMFTYILSITDPYKPACCKAAHHTLSLRTINVYYIKAGHTPLRRSVVQVMLSRNNIHVKNSHPAKGFLTMTI